MAWIDHSSGVWQFREEDSGRCLSDEAEAAISQLALFLVSALSCYAGELLWAASALCWALIICGSLLGAAAVM